MRNTEEYQTQGNNGWQNVGIYYDFVCSQNGLSLIEKSILIHMARMSFGYGKTVTIGKTQQEWASSIGISRQTFTSSIKNLIELKFLKVIHQNIFVVGGGSKPFVYSPIFPTNGRIWIQKQEENNKTDVIRKQEGTAHDGW